MAPSTQSGACLRGPRGSKPTGVGPAVLVALGVPALLWTGAIGCADVLGTRTFGGWYLPPGSFLADAAHPWVIVGLVMLCGGGVGFGLLTALVGGAAAYRMRPHFALLLLIGLSVVGGLPLLLWDHGRFAPAIVYLWAMIPMWLVYLQARRPFVTWRVARWLLVCCLTVALCAAIAGWALIPPADYWLRDVSEKAGRVARGLTAFHNARGRYPDRLEELVPEYIAELPDHKMAFREGFAYAPEMPLDGAVPFVLAAVRGGPTWSMTCLLYYPEIPGRPRDLQDREFDAGGLQFWVLRRETDMWVIGRGYRPD